MKILNPSISNIILTGIDMVPGCVREGRVAPNTYFLIPLAYMSCANSKARSSVAARTIKTKPSLARRWILLSNGVMNAANNGIAIRRAGECVIMLFIPSTSLSL